MHERAVGGDFRDAGHGGPLAGSVEEGDVDVGVGGQGVGLAGFGVCMEEEVDAAVFLLRVGEYRCFDKEGKEVLVGNCTNNCKRA